MELALVEFQYHESRGSYYQHRQPSPPHPLVAGVVELALVANFLVAYFLGGLFSGGLFSGGLFSGGLFSGGLFSGWPIFWVAYILVAYLLGWPIFWVANLLVANFLVAYVLVA